jgi:large subunit ribosomal protein L29
MKIGQLRQYREKLRGLSAEEISDELLKLRKEQFSLRMQRATGQSPKPDQFGDARRNIARLKTVQRQAQLKAAPATGGKKS